MINWFWLAELAFTLAAYVVFDGFDLGVGILSGFARKAEVRDSMIASISPLWDGNGTWLVIAGTILFGAFPVVYSIVLPALYIPLGGMLIGLAMRGVSLEFAHNAERSRQLWHVVLFAGSLLAAFMQGVSVGTYAQGVPVSHLRYAGNGLDWCSPFPLWCGVGLALGYAVLGAAWLVLKGDGDLLAFGRAVVRRLMPTSVLVSASIFALTLILEPRVAGRWLGNPELFALPIACLLAFVGAVGAARHSAPRLPYLLTALSCILLLATLAVSYLPYILPFSLTLAQAAGPATSQWFMFWGAGLFLLPLIVGYTYVVYTVFDGKVSHEQAYH
jgi:cytochrome d ubiquinol oxidase subunit II